MNRSFLLMAACFCAALPAATLAQVELSGKDRFPQFRGLSGLSGAGFGVMKDGRPSFRGAMSYTTPIGYTLGGTRLAAGLGTISGDRSPIFFRSGKDSAAGNGTGYFVVGFDVYGGAVAGGFTFLSGLGDNVSTLQYSPRLGNKLGFSVGCQDLGGSGGSSGASQPGDDDSSRSFFAACSTELSDGIHLSAGLGTRRFQKGFGSLSAKLGPQFKALVEHDGWNFNYGLAYNPGRYMVSDDWSERNVRSAEVTVFAGIIQNRYAGWSVVVSF